MLLSLLYDLPRDLDPLFGGLRDAGIINAQTDEGGAVLDRKSVV
jgi:hypothetical protein